MSDTDHCISCGGPAEVRAGRVWLCLECDHAYEHPSPREPIPARGWLTLAVVLVCAPAIAAGVVVTDRIRSAADRSAIPARARLPLLAAALLGLAGCAGLVWRLVVGG